MSKNNVFDFFRHAAQDQELKAQLNTLSNHQELAVLGKQHGFSFSDEHVEQALTEMKQQPGFFGKLMEAILMIFAPTGDNYPNTGVEPYSGEPNK